MEEGQQQKRRVNSNPRRRPTSEDYHRILTNLRKLMDKVGYGPPGQRPRASPERDEAAVAPAPAPASVPSDPRGKGLLKRKRVIYDQDEVPDFNTYEECDKKALESLEDIIVVLSIDGKVVFLSQNVSSLLGHCPEDLVGKSLLNILLDEEKEEISQKIVLNHPLETLVGKLIEFYCYVRKGNAGCDAQDTYDDKSMNKEYTFKYVKFTLYLKDCYDDSSIFLGNHCHNSESLWSVYPLQLREQQYYLVGTISVLCNSTESEYPIEIQPEVITIDSDDDDNYIQDQRTVKPGKKNKIKRKWQAENLDMECPESDSDVEIVDIQSDTWQMPFELVLVRTPSQSSICSNVSEDSDISDVTSISSTDWAERGDFTSDLESLIDLKYMLEPVDIEYEVPPDFLMNDSEDEWSSPKQGCSNEDMRKPLEEAKGPNPRKHVIDETLSDSSDEYFCVTGENTEVKKGPKIPKLTVDQVQGNQKIIETAPKCSNTEEKPVHCPEAVVEPMTCTDLASSNVTEPGRPFYSQHPRLGERFAQLCGQLVRARIYDLYEERPPYRDTEEEDREREQLIHELAQHIEMIRNLSYERPMAGQQMGQEQENHEYQLKDETVTVINDLAPRPINFYGNDNSEYPRNETHRSWDNHAECTSPLQHLPLTFWKTKKE